MKRIACVIAVGFLLTGCAGPETMRIAPFAVAATPVQALPSTGVRAAGSAAPTPEPAKRRTAPPLPGHVPLPAAARSADIVLIGEVHDNVAQHRLRLQWLDELSRDRRIAIALEQFDAERQDELDRVRALVAQAGADAPGDDGLALRARRVAEAAGFDFRGWNWDFYRPVIELALRRNLPLVATNLSPAEAARVVRGEAAAAPEPPGWSADHVASMRESIRIGHCGVLPEKAVQAMAEAQRTRDARIARSVAEARRDTGLPVVLLAGNGHVRTDIGVPRHLVWLRPADRVVAIGLLEAGDPLRTVFDRSIYTSEQPRKDPCEELRSASRSSARR